MSPTNLTCAVCLFPNVCPTDYQGPIELLSFISPNLLDVYPWLQNTPHTLTVDYFAVTADPVYGSSGPGFAPTRSYDDVQSGEQYDVVLVPGGPGSRPGKTPDAVIQFIRAQTPKAKYVLSTCTGAELLARAGVLAGKNATTNKTQYGRIKKENPGVNWIPRGRWVVDGNIWTSAGVFAGVDMAYAFLNVLAGEDIAQKIRVIVEFSNHAREDDEFAEPEPFE